MQYTEVYFLLNPIHPLSEMITYTLGDEGPFDSFQEMSDGMKAYVPSNLFDPNLVEQCVTDLLDTIPNASISYTVEAMPDVNYNEEWERNHTPVQIDDFCWVRAPFHPHRPDLPYEIEIDPKMSFGSAHHPTTYLMMRFLYNFPLNDKHLLDMGCGTAILAIFAALRGASFVAAIDVDEWAYRNACANVEHNGVDVSVRLGDAQLLSSFQTDPFDYIIANINLNILRNDMASYINVLKPGGTLAVSGFFESDIDSILAHAAHQGLHYQHHQVRDGWAAVTFVKE